MQIDIVSVAWWGPFRHTGIRVTLPNGSAWAYANTPDRGVVRQRVAEFAEGRLIASTPYRGPLSGQQVVARAESMLGSRYALLSWNCDHFVSAALGLKPESKQLQTVAWAAAAAFFLSRLTA